MKILRPVFALILLPAGYILAQGVRPLPIKASTRLQPSAVVEPIAAKVGQPILLKLQLKNVSSKVVTVGDSNFYTDYDLVVTDLSGKEPQKTKFGLAIPEMPLLRSTTLDIAPGEEVQATLEITKIYDPQRPGTYYARATRHSVWPETPEDTGPLPRRLFRTRSSSPSRLRFTRQVQIMKLVNVTLLAAVTLLGQEAPANRTLKVTIASETPTIQAGAPLQVNVTVTNISDNDVNVSDAVSSMTGQHNNYLLEVLDEWAIKRRTHV